MKLIKISQLDLITSELIDDNDQILITDISELSLDKRSKRITIGQLKLVFESGSSPEIIARLNDLENRVTSGLNNINSRLNNLEDRVTNGLNDVNSRLNDLDGRVAQLESNFHVVETESTDELISLDGYEDSVIELDR